MKFINTFDKHKNTPDITVDEYISSLHVELGTKLKKRKVVYLDTNFWLTLRDVKLNINKNTITSNFYKIVNLLSEKNQCIFPISEDTFLEVMKQTDKKTLFCTAELIDTLSEGVSLISLDERLELEILHYLMEITSSEKYKNDDFVWTKVQRLSVFNMAFNQYICSCAVLYSP